jgi:hypothetical protein
MFLDDELYMKVKQSKIEKPEDFRVLVNDLYKSCEDYYKERIMALGMGCPYSEVTALMDKTFKFWDMFIAKLEKEDWGLVDVLKDNSYKKLFMENEKLKEIYLKGK